MAGARVYRRAITLGSSAADLWEETMEENRTTLSDDEIRTGVAREIRGETADADMDDVDSDTDDTDSDSDDMDS
jgi:hypothetical protein